ncbi:MAG: hypothetical protein ACREOF_21580 [Gemmatimonadales bacterium]
MPDSLTRLLRAVLPKATAAELAEAADRLGSFVESRAAWVGDTAEGAVRRVEGVVLGRGGPPPASAPAQLAPELEDRLWTQVMGAIAPRLGEIEARARAARGSPDAPPDVAELARDAEWLIGELHAAWAREVALRARRPSGEFTRPPLPPTD